MLPDILKNKPGAGRIGPSFDHWRKKAFQLVLRPLLHLSKQPAGDVGAVPDQPACSRNGPQNTIIFLLAARAVLHTPIHAGVARVTPRTSCEARKTGKNASCRTRHRTRFNLSRALGTHARLVTLLDLVGQRRFVRGGGLFDIGCWFACFGRHDEWRFHRTLVARVILGRDTGAAQRDGAS